MNSKSKKIAAVAIAAFVTIFVSVRLGSRATRDARIPTAPIQKQNIINAVYGIGTVTASETFQVKTGVTSRILAIAVSEGEPVRKGARLLTFDSGVSVIAPFDGVVTSVSQKVGELAYPQSTILQMMDLRKRYVLIGLEQQSAAQVRPGMSVRLSFEGNRKQPLSGLVKSVYPSEGQFLVRAEVDNLPEALLPGMTLDTAIETFEKEGALVIEASFLKGSSVFVKKSGRVLEVPVRIGIVDGTRIEVESSDLKEGDLLVGGQ